ncbi:deaminase [Brevundimonas vesicularis]|uniref:deaminase n=1 Tax=Brevundimonas vesicularis TaxID=41276 RepID=UPI00384C7AE9
MNALAESLIATDAEESHPFGQRLRETFHLADVFVDGIQRSDTEFHTERFIDAFFGRTDLSPSKEEYGMYAAKSASLRSSDLSRQVGAAIFSSDGEIITQGCNEVPKALGGTYWDLEEPDFRDVMLGSDPNENLRNDIIKDLFDKLRSGGYLSKKAKDLGSASSIAHALTSKSKIVDGKEVAGGALADALIMDLTEYGRVVHAEMCAICDAARLGKSVKGSTLYCTTFPCHNCTKHILAVGVKRVVYMEPYPKRRAKELHENEISIEIEAPDKVTFMPFLGISPFRYRDIFQKGKRKGAGGVAKRWLFGEPRPMVEVVAPTHIELEAMALASLIGAIKPKQGATEASV